MVKVASNVPTCAMAEVSWATLNVFTIFVIGVIWKAFYINHNVFDKSIPVIPNNEQYFKELTETKDDTTEKVKKVNY